MRFILTMATMLTLSFTACTASLTDARPTAAPPQQPAQPQVIIVQSPPTANNNSGDDVLLFAATMMIISALMLLACGAAYMLGRMHGQRDNSIPHVRQLPPQPQIVVITESEYRRRLNQSREVISHE